MSFPRFLLVLGLLNAVGAGQTSPFEREVLVYEGAFVDLERGLVTNLAEEEGLDLGIEGRGVKQSAGVGELDIGLGKGLEDAGLTLVPRGDIGIQPIESSAGTWSFDAIGSLPEAGYENTGFPLREGLWYAVRTDAGQYAKVELRGNAGSGWRLHYVLIPGGGTELPAAPKDFQVEFLEEGRQLTFTSQTGESFLLKRRVHGEDVWQEHALGGSPWTDAEDRDRPVFYELVRVLEDGGHSLPSRRFAPAYGERSSGRLRCQPGVSIDFVEGRLNGTEAHVTVTQTFDQGSRILTAPMVTLHGEEGAVKKDGVLIAPTVNYRGENRYLMLGAGCFLKLAEGYLAYVRLVEIEGGGKGTAEIVLEWQLGQYGQLEFVPIPERPRLDVAGTQLELGWKSASAGFGQELRRTISGLRATARITPVEGTSWIDRAPVPEAWNAYAVRVVTPGGRRSPWSEEVGYLPFDEDDPSSIARALDGILESYGTADSDRQDAAVQALSSLGDLARGGLEKRAEEGGVDGDLAEALLDILDDGADEVPVARGLSLLRQRLEALQVPLDLSNLASEHAGERIWTAWHGTTRAHMDAVLGVLAANDPDPLARRVAEGMQSVERSWNLLESEAADAPTPRVLSERYDFTRDAVRALFGDEPFDGERVASLLERWASPDYPREALTLLTLAEMVRGNDLEQRDLAEIGMRLLVGKERGSADAVRVSQVVGLADPKAQCRSYGRFHSLWRGAVRGTLSEGRVVVVRPDQGIPRLQQLLDESEPGTVIVLEEGEYRSQDMNPMVRVERPGLVVRAARPGSVQLHASFLVMGCSEFVIDGLAITGQRSYVLQLTDSAVACRQTTFDCGTPGCGMLQNATLALDGCRVFGQSSGTGMYVRGSTLLVRKSLFEGFQTTIQGQGSGGPPATVLLTQTAFLGMAQAGVQVSGEGLPVFIDRCVFAGGRLGVSYLSEGVLARVLFADLQTSGNQLREGVRYDPALVVELSVQQPASFGQASTEAGLVDWFRD